MRIVAKLKEEWLEEAASFLVDLPEMRIIIPKESVSISNGRPDQVSVSDVVIVRYICGKSEVELVRLLPSCGVLVMVSSEWEEGSNLMPSSAQVAYGVTVESTEVTAHEWQAKELILVYVFD